MFNKKLLSMFVALSPLCCAAEALAATAIDAPPAARDTAESARDEAKTLHSAENENAANAARAYIKESGEEINRLETEMVKARENLAAAEAKVKELSDRQSVNDTGRAAAQARFDQLYGERELLQRALESAEATVTRAQGAAAEAEATYKRSPRPENAQASERAYNNLVRAEADRDAADREFAQIEVKMEEAQVELDKYTSVSEELNDAKLAAEDARIAVEAMAGDLSYLAESRAATQKSLETTASAPLVPDFAARDWSYFMTSMEYYSWKNNDGQSGRQLYMPLSFGVVHGPWNFGISTGYIFSNHKGRLLDNGKVSTMADLDLSVGYNKQYGPKVDVLYTFSMNVPTGKRTLNGSDAVMSDDLVRNARFGEGWSFTPGVLINWHTTREDTWSFGTSFSFNRGYTYNSEPAPAGWLNPGGWGRLDPANGWDSFIRYKHLGKNDQVVAELGLTDYSSTTDSGGRYRQGHQVYPRLVYNRVMSPKQDLMLYYWYNKEGAPSPIDDIVYGTGLNSHFFGAMWSYKTADKQALHLTMDWLKRRGLSYDLFTGEEINHRDKFTYGLSYDYNLTPSSRLRFRTEWFTMKDSDGGGLITGGRYHGFNTYMYYYLYW